jgi:hypothetical protein
MAKARRKVSTSTSWILLRDALAPAGERFGSAELAKKMLLRSPRRYRALGDDGNPVEGNVSNFSDMVVDWEESSARPAFQMLVLGVGSPEPPPGRRLYRIKLLLADVPGAKKQVASRRGRRTSALLVLAEAKRLLRGKDRHAWVQKGRKRFLDHLRDWLNERIERDRRVGRQPEAKMESKTIGDHLRRDGSLQSLLPQGWRRRR